MRKGFTLIELLTVVLIIGILASIALPNYQIAKRKAEMSNAWQLAKMIKNAEEIYYMANGHYTLNIEELDINIPYNSHSAVSQTTHRAYKLTDNRYVQILIAWGGELRLQVYPIWTEEEAMWIEIYFDNTSYKGRQTCVAYPHDKITTQACLSLGGKPLPYTTGAQSFLLP